MLTLEEVIDRYPFPSPVGGYMTLDEMQKQDIVKLAYWGRALGDLPVGYGKTVIATAVALMLEPDAVIILVPPILIVQWVNWLNSIEGAGRAIAYVGGPAHRKTLPLRARWLVMSYQVFNNDVDYLRRGLAGRGLMGIVDECQNLKGRGVLWKNTNSFFAGVSLLLMSGTIMSKPDDAYAYIKLMTPEVYRTYTQFENIHVAKRNIFKQPIEWHMMDLMQTNLNMRRVYRSKEEVHAALPKANYIPVYYDLSKEHMALYKRLMEEQLLALDDGSKIDATTAVRLYHAAQQIITQFDYFSGDPTKRSDVFDLIDNIAAEMDLGNLGDKELGIAPASKLILWTIYKRTSAKVHQHMVDLVAPLGCRSVAAYGDVNSKKSIAQFLEDAATVNLTAQPGSAGAGLNPQYLCWETALIEIPTTTIPFIQLTGRVDRKGQRFNPNIRLLIARGTIQEQLLKNLFDNDKLVQRASGSRQGIKDLIFP